MGGGRVPLLYRRMQKVNQPLTMLSGRSCNRLLIFCLGEMTAKKQNPLNVKFVLFYRFYRQNGVSAAAIHQEICTVNGLKLMSEKVIRNWVHSYKNSQIDMHYKERKDWPQYSSSMFDQPLLNERT